MHTLFQLFIILCVGAVIVGAIKPFVEIGIDMVHELHDWIDTKRGYKVEYKIWQNYGNVSRVRTLTKIVVDKKPVEYEHPTAKAMREGMEIIYRKQ